MIACGASHTVTIIYQKRNIFKKDIHHNLPPQSSPPSTISSGRGIGTEKKYANLSFCSSRPPHCAILAKLDFWYRKCVTISGTIIFQQKQDQNPDIFRYFKNPSRLIYNDQKGGHVQVKPDYMVGLTTGII